MSKRIREMAKTAGGKVGMSEILPGVWSFVLVLPGSGQVRERRYGYETTAKDRATAWELFEASKLRPVLRSALIYEMSERTTADDLERNAAVVQAFESGDVQAWARAGSLSVRLTCFANALLLNPIKDPPSGLS